MRESDVRERAFAMPLTSPAYPPGPYRFVNREFPTPGVTPMAIRATYSAAEEAARPKAAPFRSRPSQARTATAMATMPAV